MNTVLLDFILVVVGVLLIGGTTLLFMFIKQKIDLLKNENLRNLLRSIVELSGQKVLEAEQTIIRDLYKNAKDGKISGAQVKDILRGVKNSTIEDTKKLAENMGLWSKLVASNSNMGSKEDAVNSAYRWLETVVESQVYQLPPSKDNK